MRRLRANLRILGLGLLMAALNLLPLSGAAMAATYADSGRVSISAFHHSSMTAAEATASEHDQAPCNDHDASHGKLGCCVGVHCAAGYAMVPPFDQRPLMIEAQPILLPKTPPAFAGIGVGPALEPPRLSI